MNRLRTLDIKYLKGVGPKRAELLEKQLGIKSYYDLLCHFPNHYVDRSSIYKINQLNGDMPSIQLKGRFISFTTQGEGAKTRLVGLFADGTGVIEIVWFNRIKQIKDAYYKKEQSTQMMLIPLLVGVSTKELDIVRNNMEMFEDAGFIYHSRVTIWKNPVTEMQRTKALGLLHKQLKKDSAMSRVGIPDYLMVFRKEGGHNHPVHCDINVDTWQKWASPVWMDIDYGNTLNAARGRDEADEKHICPLQLDVIRRGINLWTNENDIVFTPFMGIGSEVYQALKMNRRGIGIELKESYYKQAVKNCENAEIDDSLIAVSDELDDLQDDIYDEFDYDDEDSDMNELNIDDAKAIIAYFFGEK